MKKAATARISSHTFLPRKVITSPAVRKTKLTIAPRTRENGGYFFAKFFKTVSNPVSNRFQAFCERADDNTNCCANSNQNRSNGEAIFF